jgi:hypothetical protein
LWEKGVFRVEAACTGPRWPRLARWPGRRLLQRKEFWVRLVSAPCAGVRGGWDGHDLGRGGFVAWDKIIADKGVLGSFGIHTMRRSAGILGRCGLVWNGFVVWDTNVADKGLLGSFCIRAMRRSAGILGRRGMGRDGFVAWDTSVADEGVLGSFRIRAMRRRLRVAPRGQAQIETHVRWRDIRLGTETQPRGSRKVRAEIVFGEVGEHRFSPREASTSVEASRLGIRIKRFESTKIKVPGPVTEKGVKGHPD